MSFYILCKVNSIFFKDDFAETTRYVALKFSQITEIVILF